jgi:hypothetical protein
MFPTRITSMAVTAVIVAGLVPASVAGQQLCPDIEPLASAAVGATIELRATVSSCGGGVTVEASRVRLTTQRRCLDYDPGTGAATERASDRHVATDRVAKGPAIATFTLPSACSEGITEITSAVVFEADGYEASDATVVLHRFHRQEPYCPTGAQLALQRRNVATALAQLRRAVTTTPIEAPATLVELQSAYFALRDDPEASPVATGAALDALHAAVETTPIQGPLTLWWLSENHQHLTRCLRSLSI